MITVVDVEYIKTIMDKLDEVNACNFDDIEWRVEGVKVAVSKEDEELWKMVGLSNVWFAKLHLFKNAGRDNT